MNGEYSVSYIIGVVVGFVLIFGIMFFVSKQLNADKSMKTKYDERQQIVRGEAYKYSFWTMVFLVMIYAFIDSSGIELPCVNSVVIIAIIMTSIVVHAVYCIIHDGYFGINNKPKSYYILFIFLGLFNFFIGIINTIRGVLIIDGKLDIPFANYIAGFMFIIVGISIIIRHMMNKTDDIDDEDEDGEDSE